MTNLEEHLLETHRIVRHNGWLAVRTDIEYFKFSPREVGIAWVIIDPQMNVSRYGERYAKRFPGVCDWDLAVADVKACIERKVAA